MPKFITILRKACYYSVPVASLGKSVVSVVYHGGLSSLNNYKQYSSKYLMIVVV